MTSDRPHLAIAKPVTPATRDEIDAYHDRAREEVGMVRPCVPHPSGVCAAHGIRCAIAAGG